MYAVYHGPEGLTRIADRTHACAEVARAGLSQLGYSVDQETIFDTIRIRTSDSEAIAQKAVAAGFNVRVLEDGVGLSFDETSTAAHVDDVFSVFAAHAGAAAPDAQQLLDSVDLQFPKGIAREGAILQNPIFNSYQV